MKDLQKYYFLLLSLLCFLPKQSKSQFILAGVYDTTGIYTDIIPDTLLTGFLNHASNYHENFELDIDHDGTNDFLFYNYGEWSNSGNSSYISLNSLHSNAKILSSYNTLQGYGGFTNPVQIPFYRELVDTLNLNDTISFNNRFTPLIYNSNNIQYIGEYHNGGHSGPNIFEWVNIGDKYIGIELLKNQDTLFGWIRISVSRTNAIFYTTIKDYACNKIKSNSAGIKPEEASMLASNCCIAYPNPASQIIQFSLPSTGDWRCKLYNHLGQLLRDEKYNSNTGLNIFPLISGVYYTELTLDSYNIKFRFIKQNQ